MINRVNVFLIFYYNYIFTIIDQI